MSWETIQIVIVVSLVVIVFFGMIREVIAPEILAMAAVALLLLLGILNTGDVLKVFSNTAPFTVGCLFILSAALERTGVIDAMGQAMARVPWRSPWQALMVMMLGCLFASAFINNTPIVVIMTPVIIALAHSLKSSASKYLIPLSYATILGGTCSLIGTSTNIIVDGVAQAKGLEPFGMFEISPAGVVYGMVGMLYMGIIGWRLLPDRQTLSDVLIDLSSRKFLTEVVVPQGSPMIGKTLADAGITGKRGYKVIDLIRAEGSFDPEHGEPTLAGGDRIVLRMSVAEFMGLRDTGDLVIEKNAALDQERSMPQALEPIASRGVRMMEGIVGPHSSFAGQRVVDLNLRRLYDTYILAIHRQNENLHGNFDQVRLQFGDTILLEGPPDGLKRLFERGELINLTEVTERPFRRNRAWLAVAAVLAVIVLSAFEALPIAATSFIAATIVVALGCLDAEEAYKAIHWPILMLIFGMLALGSAMESTGAGALIVTFIVGLVGGLGAVAVLSIVYAITSFLTEFMSNNATAILITPIAIGLAQEMGVDPRPFVVAVMFAASASFATPIGYQTNTFVYGAGGYRFLDFTKVGLPLNIILWIAASFIIPLFWPL
ncbi:MAG TPA: SLC13 family permease [Rhodospirillales bacterium]|nr:SLC13 family permease [Rhodospirillales bacterium]